jgi:hypothetical protein
MTVRRLKTYTGSQGYAYQYYFVGQRPAPTLDGTVYVFDVSSDRKTTFAVSVLLPKSVVTDWNQAHGRLLTGSEQYAAVKMRLFRAFDELEDMQFEGRYLQVDWPALEKSLTSLGIE